MTASTQPALQGSLTYNQLKSERTRKGKRRRQNWAAYTMVAPFAALFTLFFVLPLLYAIWISFTASGTGNFVGIHNYRYLLGLNDFWSGLLRVVYYGILQVTIMIICALVLALYLDSPYARGKRFFATIYFLPYAVPGVIAAIMWGFLFSPSLDFLLRLPVDLGLSSKPFSPLSPSVVLYAIMFIVTWEFAGYNMTIYLTSLSSIPREIIDAAHVDGASELQIARLIKLPLLRQTIIFTLVLSIIGSLQLFNEPQILAQLTPISGGYTPNRLIYTTAFSFGNIPLAAAMSVILAIVTIAASVAFFGIVRAQGSHTGEPRSRKTKNV